MAEEFTPQMHGFDKPEEQNAETAAKLAAQDINGKSSVSTEEDHATTFGALDALVEAKKKEAEAAAAPPADDEAAKKAAEEKAAAEKKAAEEAAAKPQTDDSASKIKDDLFKGIELPPGTRPKSAEAFATIKERAAREIETRDKAISDLQAKLKQAEETAAAKQEVPPEIAQELEQLREWRAKLDVEADPKFNEFTKGISQAEDFIYAQLKKSKTIDDDVIAEIKKHGGPSNVKMEKIFAAIGDPTTQRLVEAKLADIEMMRYNREQAVNNAKENIKGYLSERQKAFEDSTSQHHSATEEHLKELTTKLKWMAPITPPANADEKVKADAEAHNKFVAEVQEQMKLALQDDTPQMRALMIVGMAQLIQYQRVLEGLKAEKTSLGKQVEELTAKLDRFKSASTSRLRESAAPPGGRIPEKKDDDGYGFAKTAGESLDALARQLAEERAKAGAA